MLINLIQVKKYEIFFFFLFGKIRSLRDRGGTFLFGFISKIFSRK
jgi:hypothetical protein